MPRAVRIIRGPGLCARLSAASDPPWGRHGGRPGASRPTVPMALLTAACYCCQSLNTSGTSPRALHLENKPVQVLCIYNFKFTSAESNSRLGFPATPTPGVRPTPVMVAGPRLSCAHGPGALCSGSVHSTPAASQAAPSVAHVPAHFLVPAYRLESSNTPERTSRFKLGLCERRCTGARVTALRLAHCHRVTA